MPKAPSSMTNDAYIDFCFQSLLRRGPDDREKAHYREVLANRVIDREMLFVGIVECEEFKSLAKAREFVPPGHFYSAIPSEEDRAWHFRNRQPGQVHVAGININEDFQLGFLDRLSQYQQECPFPDKKTEGHRYYFENPSFSFGDAITLYGMMREFTPSNVIEIGSGHSSCAMLDTNDSALGGRCAITFIEPFPQLLKSLIRRDDDTRRIINKPIQEVDACLFDVLRQDDILFVDSTHVSKLESDVNRIVFDILPSLAKGVVIHFHDIFWPFEYPEDWIRQGRAWNEAYLLRAFLQYNHAFEILFFSDFIRANHLDLIQGKLPKFLLNSGGSLWLRKIR